MSDAPDFSTTAGTPPSPTSVSGESDVERVYPRRAHGLTAEQLSMPVERLIEWSRYPLHVTENKEQLYEVLAREMADTLKQRNQEDGITRWLLPVGPKDHYPLLADITNKERISWRNVHCFHMDEWLDWQGRLVSYDHPLSFKRFCDENLYNLIDPELRPPKDQIVFPDVADIDAFSERIKSVGGLDCTFAGFGYRGHVAFNEPPSTRWHYVTVEELALSKTRVVPLLDDTIVAHSHRTTGGYTQPIPRMAVTVGMKDILSASQLYLITDGGDWKRWISRVVLLTTEPDSDLPVTLCHLHDNVKVLVDHQSVAPIQTELSVKTLSERA